MYPATPYSQVTEILYNIICTEIMITIKCALPTNTEKTVECVVTTPPIEDTRQKTLNCPSPC